MALLFLSPGQTFGTVGGFQTTDVVGTNSNETVFVTADAKANFDASFNRGGDVINIGGNAGQYTASISGSSLLLTANNGANILIPFGTVGSVINFADADPRTLSFNSSTNQLFLGDQQITANATPVTPGTPAIITVSSPSVLESDNGSTQLSYRLTLNEPQNQALTVNISTSDGTATAGEDYIGLAQQVTFAAGQTVLIVNVSVIGDLREEPNETVILTVSGAGITTASGVGTIINDDFDNVAPVFNGGDAITLNVNEDSVLTSAVTATDANNDPLIFSLVTGTSNGTVNVASNGSFTYTPSANYNGSDSFVVSVNDGQGGNDTQTVNINVAAVNDAPTFPTPTQNVSVQENIATSTVIADANASDIDVPGGADVGVTYSFAPNSPDGANLFSIDPATGQVRFLQSPDFEAPQSNSGNNTYTVVVTATDAAGATATQTISINVTDVQEGFTNGNDSLTGTDQPDRFFASNNQLGAQDVLNGRGPDGPVTKADLDAAIFDVTLFQFDEFVHTVDNLALPNGGPYNFAGFILNNIELFTADNDTGFNGNIVTYDLSSSGGIDALRALNSTNDTVFNFANLVNGTVFLIADRFTNSASNLTLDVANGQFTAGIETLELMIRNIDDTQAAGTITVDGLFDTINICVDDITPSNPAGITFIQALALAGGTTTNNLNIRTDAATTANGFIIVDTLPGSIVNIAQDAADQVGSLGLDFSGATSTTTVTANDGNNTLTGGNAADNITVGDGNNTIVTGPGAGPGIDGNDTVTAGDGQNTITSAGGNDQITVGDGGNTITTNAGADKVVAGDGADNISTGSENDTVNAGGGNDIVNAGSGNDQVFGEAGDDTIDAGSGNDSVDGGDGCDSITAGTGLDTLLGGADQDVFVFASGDFDANFGLDSVNGGGAELDDLRIGSGSTDVNFINVANVDHLTITDSGSTTLGLNAQAGGIRTINLDRTSTFAASDRNDTVGAGLFTEDLVVNTRGGTDSVLSGAGNDTFNVGSNFTDFKGDTISNSVDNALDDTDNFNAGLGTTDTLNVDGDTNLTAGNGFSGFEFMDLDTRRNNASNNGNVYNIVVNNANAPSLDSNGILNVDGSSLDIANDATQINETLTFDASAVTNYQVNVQGGASADTLTGGLLGDTLIGNGGNDTLDISFGGNDSATGGDGSDNFVVNTGGGNGLTGGDTLDGGDNTDTITADAGLNDAAFANSSSIEVLTVETSGSTTIAQNAQAAGIRTVNLNGGNDTLNASGYDADGDLLVNAQNNNGTDSITTGGGDDTVVAGTGNNTIVTNAGDDLVIANNAVDNVSLGAGADRYRVSGNELQQDDTINGGNDSTPQDPTNTPGQGDTIELDNSFGAVTADVNLNNVTNIENYVVMFSGDRVQNVTDTDNNTLTFNNGNILSTREIYIDASNLTDPDDSFTVTLAPTVDEDFGFELEGSSTVDIFDKQNLGNPNDIVIRGNGGMDQLIIAGFDLGTNVQFDGGADKDRITQNGLDDNAFNDDGFRFVFNVEQVDSVLDRALEANLGQQADKAGITMIIGGDSTALGSPTGDTIVLDSDFNNAVMVELRNGSDFFNAGASSAAVNFVFNGDRADNGGDVLDADDTLIGGNTSGDVLDINADDNASTSADATNVTRVERINITSDNDTVGADTINTDFALTVDTTAGEIDGGSTQIIDASTFGSADDFTLNGGGASANLDVRSGAGDDDLTTGSGNDTVSAGEGDNTVSSNGGADTVIINGNGNNFVDSGSGNDGVTITGDGDNTVLGGANNDTILVDGDGNNLIDGGSGNDDIETTGGDNTIIGGTGDDTITTGDSGSNLITGGANNADNNTGDVFNLGAASDDLRYVNLTDSQGLTRDCVFNFDMGAGDDRFLIETQVLTFAAGGATTLNYLGDADDFAEAAIAISLTANDNVVDIVYDRANQRLLFDTNDDGIISGLDLTIDVKNIVIGDENFGEDSFSDFDFVLIDTIGPEFDPVTASVSEDRLATTETEVDTTGDFDDAVTNTGFGSVTYDADQDGNFGEALDVTVVRASGTLTVDEVTGEYTFAYNDAFVEAMDDGETYEEIFTITVRDDNGNTTDSTFTVTINGADDAPTLVDPTDGTVTEDNLATTETTTGLSGTLMGDDVDGDDLTYGIVGGTYNDNGTPGDITDDTVTKTSAYGTLTVDVVSGDYTYVYNDDAVEALNAGAVVNDDFTFSVSDGDDPVVTQTYRVVLTGADDAPFIVNATDVTGSVTEDNNVVVGSTAPLAGQNVIQDFGSFTFDDVDLDPTQDTFNAGSLTVTPDVGNYGGTLVATITDGDVTNGTGTVQWEYELSNAMAQELGEDQTVTDTFTITIDDGNGGTVSQVVTVTVNGTNDVPTIQSATTDEQVSVEEDSGSDPLTATGTIDFEDVDELNVSDTHTATVENTTTDNPGGGQLGTFTLDPTNIGDPNESVDYTFSVDNADVQFLAEGQTVTQTYTVRITDDNGAFVDQVITVLIQGNNDAPDIFLDGVDDTAAATIVETNAPLTADGLLTVEDVDTIDTVDLDQTNVTETPSLFAPAYMGATALADMFTINGVVSDTVNADSPGEEFSWEFNSAPEAFDYLNQGESVEIVYEITASDSSAPTTGTDTQNVTITINGTNDLPEFSLQAGDDDDVTLVESDAPDIALTATDTLTINDPDLNDEVTVALTNTTITSGNTGDPTGVTAATWFMLTAGPIAADPEYGPTPADTNNVTWTFDSIAEDFNYLDDGESLTIEYEVTATDDAGATDVTTVTITVEGTNDAPEITVEAGDAASAAIVETDAALTATDTLTVRDPDLSDEVTVTTGFVSATPGGGAPMYPGTVLFADMFSTSTPGPLDAEPTDINNITWEFDTQTETFDYLAVGETVELVYSVTVTDDSSITDTQNVTITITGTNDAPVATVEAGDDVTQTYTEDTADTADTVPGSPTGTFTLRDADITDTNALTFTVAITGNAGTYAPNDAALLAMLSLAPNPADADPGDTNNIAYAFDAGSTAAFDYLDSGEQAVLTYTVTADDGNGGTTTQDIIVTINGVNDGPTMTLEDATETTFSLLALDPDTSDDPLTLSNPINGDAQIANGNNNGMTPETFIPVAQAASSATALVVSDGDIAFDTLITLVQGTVNGDLLAPVSAPRSGLYYGFAGNDTITGGDLGDTIYGGIGNDLIDGGTGGDVLDGGLNDDVIIGGGGDDTIVAGLGSDTVDGGLGNDVIDLTNQDGGNYLILRSGDGTDTVTNFGGISSDKIEIDGFADRDGNFGTLESQSENAGANAAIIVANTEILEVFAATINVGTEAADIASALGSAFDLTALNDGVVLFNVHDTAGNTFVGQYTDIGADDLISSAEIELLAMIAPPSAGIVDFDNYWLAWT